MHVDLDAFYASVEQLRRPELRGRPVIVGGAGVDGERGVVAAASYEARPFGVRSAMPLSRARRLCPTAIFVPCDFPAYREASKSVFAILDRYSPVIEPIALDEAYLDLTGEDALMGPADRVALRLRDEVKSRCGLDLSIGAASLSPRSPPSFASRGASWWFRPARRRRSSPHCHWGSCPAAGRPRRSGWNESGFAPSVTWPRFQTRCWVSSSASTAASSGLTRGASIPAPSCRRVIRRASRARSPLTGMCGRRARS